MSTRRASRIFSDRQDEEEKVSAQIRIERVDERKARRTISNPPSAGPSTQLIWNMLLFQVTAFAKISRGTRVGKKELRAAQPNVRTDAESSMHANKSTATRDRRNERTACRSKTVRSSRASFARSKIEARDGDVSTR